MQTNQVEAVQAAVDFFGSQAALARALEVTPVTVGQWLKPENASGRSVPPKQCVRIEQLTDKKVTRRDLRPEDYWEIWPELAQAQSERVQVAINPVAVSAPKSLLQLANGLELVERRLGPLERRIEQSGLVPKLDKRVGPADRRELRLAAVDSAGQGAGCA